MNNINTNNISEEQLSNSPPPYFTFIENIYTKCDSDYGLNESFDIFKSELNANNYLIVANKNNNNIDIINIESNKLIKSIKNNPSKFIYIKYFQKIETKKNYLITINIKNAINIYEFSEENNFEKINLLLTIITKKEFNNTFNFINSTLIFNIKINSKLFDILLVSSRARYMEEYPTLIYNIKNGQELKEISHTKKNMTRFMIPWYNKNDDNYYLIELCEELLIVINILYNNIYAKLDEEKFKSFNTGFVHELNDIDFLFVADSCGQIQVFNLFSKEICFKIDVRKNKSNIRLYGLILWNYNYLIVNDDNNKSIIVIDLKNKYIIGSTYNEHNDSVRCIKRIRHKKYGECLITGGDDHFIKLFKSNNDISIPIFQK
jgi:hypothetical protein